MNATIFQGMDRLGIPQPLAPAGQEVACVRLADRQRIAAMLAAGQPMALLLFEIENFAILGQLFGAATSQALAELAVLELQFLAADHFGCPAGSALDDGGSWWLEVLGDGRMFLLLAGAEAREQRLPDLCMALRMHLKGRLRKEAMERSGQMPDLLAGHATLVANCCGTDSLEGALYCALCDAQRVARGQIEPEKLSLLGQFRDVLAGRRLSSVYQPIVDLAAGTILAWEALTRGPVGSFFQQPTVLFDFAEETDQVFALERACRQSALDNLGRLEPGERLFLNLHPQTLVSPDFTPAETLKLLGAAGLAPEQVVFEITERHCVQDFTQFHRILEQYRSQGFQVAVDDVGTGYSGLWSIAEIRPEFIKIDMSLVRHVDTNPVKRALLETFVAFADKIGSRLIVEGIETEAELATVMRLGVHLGQGYFLGRPAHPRPQLTTALPQKNDLRERIGNLEVKCSIPLRELATPSRRVAPGTPVNEVRKLLEDDAHGAVAVVEGHRPVGLVMCHSLDRALATQYGLALYYRRPVERIMDADPLVLEADVPAETAAQLAMARDKSKLYDHVVVTHRGQLLGLASVQRIMDALAAVQVEMAKGASPLTGLPGNLHIERELETRAASGRSFGIIYGDLDNFKAYNDTYGFGEGDQIILLCARIMVWAVRRHGGKDDFVGHLGGDDFVCVVAPERAERICKAMTRVFGRLIVSFYNPQDIASGGITAKDRGGNACRFPLVSLSLAIVDVRGPTDLEAIGQRAAEVKRFAKSMPGNVYVRDRRAPLGV